jgi:hypothetical protein
MGCPGCEKSLIEQSCFTTIKKKKKQMCKFRLRFSNSDISPHLDKKNHSFQFLNSFFLSFSFFSSRLARHKNDLHALLHETEEFGDTTDGRRTPRNVKFRFRDIFKSSVLYPFIVILILMFLLQFSGQVRSLRARVARFNIIKRPICP